MVKAVIFDMFETLITQHNSPVYFAVDMAAEAGIDEDTFVNAWKMTGEDRTVGKVSTEDVLKKILLKNDRYSDELLNKIMVKRISSKKECFLHMHDEIVPMLEKIKHKNLKAAVISNCFSEEAMVIRQSQIVGYFDKLCLSCELGVKKPDAEIFTLCMNGLNVCADECLYIGDGGSGELEAAYGAGMQVLQAVWYLNESGNLKEKKSRFQPLQTPLDAVQYIEKVNEA